MTTTREAALEAALKDADLTIKSLLEVMATPDMQQCCNGRMCGCMGSTVYQEAEHYARQDLALIAAALSTPATEPQGYVEGLEAACRFADQVSRDLGWHRIYDVTGAALAARPAPQPAADTRVVSLEDLKNWRDRCAGALPKVADEIRAIIGTATPAQPDKIAEAARGCLPETYASGVHCKTCGQSWGEDGPEQCPNAALAGKGE